MWLNKSYSFDGKVKEPMQKKQSRIDISFHLQVLMTRSSPLPSLCILFNLTMTGGLPSVAEKDQNARRPFFDEVTNMLLCSLPFLQVMPLQAKEVMACAKVLLLKSCNRCLKMDVSFLGFSQLSEQPFHLSLFSF